MKKSGPAICRYSRMTRGQQRNRYHRNGGDIDRSPVAIAKPQTEFVDRAETVERSLYFAEQQFGPPGRDESSQMAVKQREAQDLLDIAQQMADRRLSDVESRGGARHGAGDHHGSYCLDVPEGELVRHGHPERESTASISEVVTRSSRVRGSVGWMKSNFDQSGDAGKGREACVADLRGVPGGQQLARRRLDPASLNTGGKDE